MVETFGRPVPDCVPQATPSFIHDLSNVDVFGPETRLAIEQTEFPEALEAGIEAEWLDLVPDVPDALAPFGQRARIGTARLLALSFFFSTDNGEE